MDSKSKAVLKKDYLYYEHVKTHIEQLLSKFPTLRTRLVLDPGKHARIQRLLLPRLLGLTTLIHAFC